MPRPPCLQSSHNRTKRGVHARPLDAVTAPLAALMLFFLAVARQPRLALVLPSSRACARERAKNAHGGITAWNAIGGATVPLDTSTYEEAP